MRLTVPQRRRAKPSLIPLIDVMLVLLFFFMLATTYASYTRTPLKLAPGGRASGLSNDPQVVSAVLLADGRVRVDGTLLNVEDAILLLKKAKEVRLSPAPGVPLQTLLLGWERLGAEGVNVQLAEGAR